jgi:chromosome segregation ATPase
MTEDIQTLKARVDNHERAIEQMESSTQRMLDKMDKVADGLSGLTQSFKEYTVRHEYVAEQNKKLQADFTEQAKIVRSLENQASANQPVIDGIRALNAKLIWFIVVAIAGPALTVAAVVSKG